MSLHQSLSRKGIYNGLFVGSFIFPTRTFQRLRLRPKPVCRRSLSTMSKRIPRSRWDVFEKSMRGPSSQSQREDKKEKHGSWFGARNTSTWTAELAVPAASASILLISPQNRILLLHRVNTSSSFASAHVFPGGHLSPQDGQLPPPSSPLYHQDSPAYRMAAIRECFEESGILLAHSKSKSAENGQSKLVELTEQERDSGRKDVHAEKVNFADWLKERSGEADVEGLIPFTRWLTPASLPKRYSTQMYLYFLPLESSLGVSSTQMHVPTPDGGVEHTAAQFMYAQEWIDLSLKREILLFPPQFFLLSLVAVHLTSPETDGIQPGALTSAYLQQQRNRLIDFVMEDGDPTWAEKCISPDPAKREERGKYLIMGLSRPGPELEGTNRKGDSERVLRVELDREMERGRRRPHPTEVVWSKGILGIGKDASKL